ncbi:MAG TPA: hypothetical protein VFW19_11345 [Allosphingosinicella sp.]|nr:hypothetical protein [Allosphingosinicella sp.]
MIDLPGPVLIAVKASCGEVCHGIAASVPFGLPVFQSRPAETDILESTIAIAAKIVLGGYQPLPKPTSIFAV